MKSHKVPSPKTHGPFCKHDAKVVAFKLQKVIWYKNILLWTFLLLRIFTLRNSQNYSILESTYCKISTKGSPRGKRPLVFMKIQER